MSSNTLIGEIISLTYDSKKYLCDGILYTLNGKKYRFNKFLCYRCPRIGLEYYEFKLGIPDYSTNIRVYDMKYYREKNLFEIVSIGKIKSISYDTTNNTMKGVIVYDDITEYSFEQSSDNFLNMVTNSKVYFQLIPLLTDNCDYGAKIVQKPIYY